MKQHELYDPLIDAFYKSLRKRAFDQIENVIEQLRTGLSSQLQYAFWADYFAGIVAEERDRDWAAAEEYYRSVLERGADLILRAHVLLSLGVAYDKQARWAESVRACEESASAWATLGYPVKRALVLRQIAISYRSGYFAGEFEPEVLKRAATYCRDALETFQKHLQLPPETVFYEPDLTFYIAITWYELGNIEIAAGNWEKAIEYFQQLLTIWQERGDRYHAGFAYLNLGTAYQMQGPSYWDLAESMYQQALSHFREFKETYFEFNVQACLAALHLRKGKLVEAIEYYDKSLAMIETMRSGVSSESARSGFFATVVNIYANAILIQIKVQATRKAFDYVERARARAFLDSLVTGTTDYTERIDTKTLSLTELQYRLPPDSVLLEYFTTGLLKSRSGRMTEQQAANSVLYPTAKTLLFAVTQDDITVYDLGLSPNTLLTSNLEQLVEEYFLPAHLRRMLYEKLIAPVESLLRSKKRIYVIPHGPLHYIPFHALVASDGDTLLRADGPEIVYAPSATILFRDLKPKDQPTDGTCLAIGYNGEAEMQLRFAEEEAAYIAHMAGGASLVGPFTKKESLYRQAPNYQALHFSCHGEFDPDSPLESMLHIGPGETLTGQEIMDNLRLNCDLVTLSACESGLSKVQRGDELYGLIRAFMVAGAPAIIATLWRVDERSTLIFAEKFYQLIQQGLSYATALKEAQLYLKNLPRKAAREILSQHMVNAAIDSATDTPLLLQADKYLKSLAVADAPQADAIAPAVLLLGEQDDDKIFAEPKFWAPFVLIGERQIDQAGQSSVSKRDDGVTMTAS